MAIKLWAEAFSVNMAALVFCVLQRYYMNECHTFLCDFCYHVAFEDLKVWCANVDVTSQVCVCVCVCARVRIILLLLLLLLLFIDNYNIGSLGGLLVLQ